MAALAPGMPRWDPTAGFAAYDGPISLLNTHYYASLGFCGLFGVVLSVVFLIAPLLWGLSAMLCCCVQSCRHAVPAPVYPASRSRVRKTKAVLFLLGCAAIAGAACVWAAGGKLRATLLDILELGIAQVDLMLAQAAQVLSVLSSATPGLQDAGADASSIADAATTLQDASDRVSIALSDYRFMAEDAFYRLAFGCTLLGAALVEMVLFAWIGGALAPRRGARHFLGFATFVIWLWLCIGWVICGITYVLYLFIGDACGALPVVLADPVGTGFASKLQCLDPVFVAQSRSDARQPVFDAVAGINDGLQECHAGMLGPVSPAGYVCSPVVSQPGGVAYADRTTPCMTPYSVLLANYSTAYDSNTCPDMPQASGAALAASAAAAQSLVAVLPQIDALVGCAFVGATLEGLHEQCAPLRTGVRQLFGGLLLADLAFSLLLLAALWAYRHVYRGAADAAISKQIEFSVGDDYDEEAANSGAAVVEPSAPPLSQMDAAQPPAQA